MGYGNANKDGVFDCNDLAGGFQASGCRNAAGGGDFVVK